MFHIRITVPEEMKNVDGNWQHWLMMFAKTLNVVIYFLFEKIILNKMEYLTRTIQSLRFLLFYYRNSFMILVSPISDGVFDEVPQSKCQFFNNR